MSLLVSFKITQTWSLHCLWLHLHPFTNLLLVPHGALAPHHDLASSLLFQLFCSHSSRSQNASHEVILKSGVFNELNQQFDFRISLTSGNSFLGTYSFSVRVITSPTGSGRSTIPPSMPISFWKLVNWDELNEVQILQNFWQKSISRRLLVKTVHLSNLITVYKG